MRALSTDQQGVWASGMQAEFIRVWVKDGGGTFRDLTTYANGNNMVKTVVWSENVTDPHATVSIALEREVYRLSLSPLMSTSALNKAFDYTAIANSLIAVARDLYIEVAIVPMDKKPASGDWFEVFRGKVDTFDAGGGGEVKVTGRAQSGRLAQQYIKTERVYSFAADGGHAVPLRIWEPDIALAFGEYVLPATRGETDPGFERFFGVTSPGTTGETEPDWTAGSITDGSVGLSYVGATTIAGNPVEEIMQNILDDNRGTGDPAVTLYTPTSPLWDITQFLQQRTFTLDAVRALAQQIGWDIRYKWKVADSAFAFTFYEPDRAVTSPMWTFGAVDYGEPDQLQVDIAEIRNSWRIIYTSTVDLWPDGQGRREVIEVSDPDSIAKYGELWAEIQEDTASQIDTESEATTLVSSALSDCAEPTAVMSVPLMRGFPWVEVNDFYEFSANQRYFDLAQQLAVTGWSHSFENGKLKSKLDVRGKPTTGALTWISRQVHPKIQIASVAHRLLHFSGPKTASLTLGSMVGGQRFTLKADFDKIALPAEYEIHIYDTPGTTLSSATLMAVSKSPEHEFSHLVPGKVYYTTTVIRHHNEDRLIRGQPSVESSFVAGQAQAGHLASYVEYGRQPINGGFETQVDASGLPDHWTITSGALGTQVIVQTGAGGVSGARWLEFVSDPETGIISDRFGIDTNIPLELSFYRQNVSGSSTTWSVYVNWFDSDEAFLSLNQIDVDITDSAGTWVPEKSTFTPPTGARFASVLISCNTAGGADFYVDEVRLAAPAAVGPVINVNTVTVIENLVLGDAGSDSSGTPGDATVNGPGGRCAIAAGTSQVTISNTQCFAATSGIWISVLDADLTGGPYYVPFSNIVDGAFSISSTVTVTSAVRIDWWLTNRHS